MRNLQPVVVADASVFVEIERLVPLSRHADVFIELADKLTDEALVFCEQLLGEIERVGTRQAAHLFVKQGRASCFHGGADYNLVRKTMRQFRLVDPMERREVAAPYVLAQACELTSLGHNVTLATEDFRKKPPPQVSLGYAADQLGIPRINTLQMLSAFNVPI